VIGNGNGGKTGVSGQNEEFVDRIIAVLAVAGMDVQIDGFHGVEGRTGGVRLFISSF